jgi:hypothetical protein
MKVLKGLSLIILMVSATEAQIPNFTPPTPLLAAAVRDDTVEVDRILETGADPNQGQIAGFRPIFFAINQHNMDMFKSMLRSGANVNVRDASGATTLMWAAADELARTDLVAELLRLGVDVNATNKAGETALVWALRRGTTPVVSLLRQAGATDNGGIRTAVERAMPLVQKGATEFIKTSACVSCHNQSLPQMATAAARDRGFAVNEVVAAEQSAVVLKFFGAAREMMLREPEHIPDPPISLSYALLGLAAEGHQADETTAAMAWVISQHQLPDGRFRTLPARPPIESSEFTATALSIRALKLYGQQPETQIAAARAWLQSTKPDTGEDMAMRLLGLAWSNADPVILRTSAEALVALQRPDGGWAQLANLTSDAYATGQALVALAATGQVGTSDPAYQRGIDYLLRTQLADGSWHVRTRAVPFQMYRDAGFPHGKDQFISIAGTSWAIMALSQCEEE